MAVLTPTKIETIPFTNKKMVCIAVVISNTAATDEWVETGLNEIDYVVGNAVIAGIGVAATLNFTINNQGSDTGEPDKGGALGIESATATPVHVTVIGN